MANNCGFCHGSLSNEEITPKDQKKGVGYFCVECGKPHDKFGRLIGTGEKKVNRAYRGPKIVRGHKLEIVRPRVPYFP